LILREQMRPFGTDLNIHPTGIIIKFFKTYMAKRLPNNAGQA